MQRFLINEYEDGWSIEYGMFGLWSICKDGTSVDKSFSIYRDAEKRMRELQEEEWKQRKASCLAMA